MVALAERAPPRPLRLGLLHATAATLGLLLLSAWGHLFVGQGARPADLLTPATLEHAAAFLRGFAGLAENGVLVQGRGGEPIVPAYLRPDYWLLLARLAYETVAMSVLAIGLAGLGSLITVMPAARTSASGDLTLAVSPASGALFAGVRWLYISTRGIPELIWAMILVFVLSPGILPGALALGLHNFGILGKLCAEVVEDLDPRPVRALRLSGAGPAQALLYGVLPQVLPQFLTYTLYRWEVIIRTTIVVGFVSAGGLGREFRLAMSFFHYTELAAILLTYLLLVLTVDLISTWLRRLAA